MVTKSVYTMSRKKDQSDDPVRHGINLDHKMSEVLASQKNVINNYYENKKWDKHKKQANLYELVFTTGNTYPSISSVNPLSRSYFKHWEILKDFEGDLASIFSQKKMRCAFLAEGPGGFIEAFNDFRKRNDIKESVHSKDEIYGITLISSDKSVPSWRLSKEMISKYNITLLFGPDGDGSLYSLRNINFFIDEIGLHSCDYITADGGFDFSDDFNHQEESSIKLIITEVYTTLQIQKKGGAFLLKIYDISLPITKKIMHVLYQLYESITFVKPLTSRPANSEKYVLCLNFLGSEDSDFALAKKYADMFYNCIKTNTFYPLLSLHVPKEFEESVSFFNVIYVIKQIIHINMTLCYIFNYKDNKKDDESTTLRIQIENALKWCHKYAIPISITNLQFYRTLCLQQQQQKQSNN